MMSAGLRFEGELLWGEVRCAMFDADRYVVALCDAEPDAGRMMTAPLLYGQGLRYLASGGWRPVNELYLDAKLGATALKPPGVQRRREIRLSLGAALSVRL